MRADEPGVALLRWSASAGNQRPTPRGRSTALVPGARAVRAVVAVRAAHRAGAWRGAPRPHGSASITSWTVCSQVLPSVVRWSASSAARSGATARPESAASRRRRSARIGLGLVARRVQAALLGPPSSPLLRRGVEIQLEVGVRQDVRADVSPGHHDPAGIGERPLTRHERRAHRRHGRELAHPLVDLGRMDRIGDVLAVEPDAAIAAMHVRDQVDAVEVRDERRRVLGSNGRARARDTSARGTGARCRGTGSPGAPPRPRRRCSCPTRPAHRARRRDGARPGRDRAWAESRAHGAADRRVWPIAVPGGAESAAPPRGSGRATRPMRSPSSRSGPMRTRARRATGTPTCANIRRSWRFQP